MWFRLSGGGSSGGSGADSTDDASPTLPTTSSNTLTVPNAANSEPSRFEKFRRASFRRKSTGQMAARKRSKSPHFILQADKSTSLEEADEDAEHERNVELMQERLKSSEHEQPFGSRDKARSTQDLYKSELDIVLNNKTEGKAATLLPRSDTKPEHKKATLKSIKTDPPKRKFYKNFTSTAMRGQGSLESADVPKMCGVGGALTTLSECNTPKSTQKQRGKATRTTDEDTDDEDEAYTDTDDDSTDTDDEGSDADADNLSPKRGKEKKILLTDPKYKHNRIEKSSSKTKMAELEKRESLKRTRSARKVAAAAQEATAPSPQKKKDKRAEKEASAAAKKQTRGHNNLNLQALVKFVMNNKKFLNNDEFTFTRRKSMSEAATNVITVAATCKPLPIALKYAPDVAETPQEHDAKAERNVVLVKKQNLKNSFCDRLNNYNNNNNNECNLLLNTNDDCTTNNSDKDKKKKQKKQKKKSVELEESAVNREIYKCLVDEDTQKALDAKVKRNSSNSSKSSKSSGNFEDEAFYSCDELEREERARLSAAGGNLNQRSHVSISGVETSPNTNTSSSNSSTSSGLTMTPPSDETSTQTITTVIKRKASSPSLTSRVAAKINEKTNNYRNRRAVAAAAAAAASKVAKKQRKGQVTNGAVGGASAGAGAEKRAEFYKQLSVERLHTSAIVRQPSDRRPDVGNQALRSNGNATTQSVDNTDDVQLRLPSNAAYPGGGVAGDASGGIGAGKGASGGRGARESNAPSPGDASDLVGGNAAADTNAQDAAEGKDARRERLHQQHQNKSAPVSVNRSESYKERLSQKRNRNSRRKTSDPSLTSRPNDEQADVGLSNSNYTASSNSSLSSGGGSESPSTSMEQMGGAGGGGATATATGHPITHHHSMHAHHTTTPHHHVHQHSHQDSFHGSIGSNSMNTSFWGSSFGGVGSGQPGQRQWNFESDDDDDLNEADWSSNVTAEILAALNDAEKKRQEIINEIYQTERSHVRILKLLERLFLCPLQESNLLTPEHLMLLFPPALLSLREIHATFEQQLKQRRIEHNHVVTHIGDLLSSMFYDKSGEDLCQYAAQFCARQQIALEALKEKRRKDEQLHKLLNKAESHKACRRLQLKDLLPAVLQRLTKYPLLFENLYKVTIRVVPENTTEAEAIQRALESSKKILVDVNQAVKTAEDAHKLQNIQKKLDKSTFDKDEFKNLDLTQYRLIHDGSLTMKKNPSIQLHGLLFEDMIVLLTKQDDKYSLKYLHATRNTEVNNKPVSPIMSIDSETLVRQEAADKNSFFLIKTKTSQMLELRAPSSSECKTWFKHISDAAEQYKPRSKNANHEPVDDPAIATLPHSNTKESLELTPERPPPASATATVTTTPLAPMMPIATATSVNVNNNNNNNDHHNVQLRNGRRESTPTAGSADYKMRLSHNELSPSIGSSTAALSSASTASLSSTSAVNRTMSTRSCGEPNNNDNDGYENTSVTLRHTQSARQASNGGAGVDEFGSNVSGGAGMGSGSKRDSASIVYSNNSNNTRTLMQSSPPLVEPTAIQISISPAHTAEPVLTPAERLRRLDASIREGLLEKQKIICDMFRLPVEHFHEIVDIAAMPEAPKDSADIALAAYAQVQSLTEVLNEYMHVTHEQEISAVSTAVCDQCHEKQQQQQQQQHQHNHEALTPLTGTSSNSSSTSTMNSTGSSNTTQIAAASNEPTADIPPPLPPPNRQIAQQQTPTTAKTPTSTRTVLQNALMDADIHEDDDGYCEIDELRLPALPPALASKAAATKATTPAPPLPPPAGSMKAPPLPPPPTTTHHQQQKQTQTQEEKNATTPVSTSTALTEADTANAQACTAELVKRQSTISADSIPEESADEVTQALNDDRISEGSVTSEAKEENRNKEETANVKVEDAQKEEVHVEVEKLEVEKKALEEGKPAEASDLPESTTKTTSNVEPQSAQSGTSQAEETIATPTTVNATTVSYETSATAATTSATDGNADEHMEVNDTYEALSSLNDKLQNALAMVDNSTQTSPLTLSLTNALAVANAANLSKTNNIPFTTCGPNRIQHANSLEPSVPCHALNTIVSSLNSQISLLLPKINERDMERERLRKENQHLRELLNAMHERQRVEAKLETPTDANAIISAVCDAPIADETDGSNTNTTTPNINSNSPAAGTAAVENTSVTLTLDTAKATVSNTTATTEQPSTPTIKIEATPITTTTESKN